MESAVTTSPAPDESEVEAVLARLSEQFKEIREQMQADDAEIARLKVESAALRAETHAILARLQG
jgi:Spy/CpxP family protein refolding chaperone